MPNLFSSAIRIALWLGAFYLIYCGLFFFMQRSVLFPGTRIAPPDGTITRPPAAEQVWLDTQVGRVEAWFLPPSYIDSETAMPIVIAAHGNAELIDFLPDEFALFTQMGIGVLLVEYPGYGRSEGYPSQDTITEAFVAAYDWAVARDDVDATRVVLFGRSLGGGAVCALAMERPTAALILVSTFTSVQSFTAQYFAPQFLVRDPFDNLACARSYAQSMLIIHGLQDTLIPPIHGVTLYEAAQQGTLINYNCGHNDCPPNQAVYERDVMEFLRTAGIIL